MAQVIILHGYSDNRASFQPLAQFLGANGFTVTQIYLGDYISLEDTVTIQDLAKAFGTALADKGIACTAASFDVIAHSTGSLVTREWLTRYYLEEGLPCPLRRYLMLAPANFGSPLGSVGKTMLGRVVKGWSSGFQSGTQVLNALEMASPYTWALAKRDLFGAKSFYQPDECMAAVLVGSKPYQEGLRQLVDKNGGDGTVYVCTANLNVTGMSLALGRKNSVPSPALWPRSAGPIAFGVFPNHDHASITRPDLDKPLGDMVLEFLQLEDAAAYGNFLNKCAALTAATLPTPPAPPPTQDIFHTYQNLVAHVKDDLGFPVKDYFLEFFEKAATPADETTEDDLMVKIHTEILEDVHVYEDDPSYRSLLFDLTDLRAALATGEKLVFSASAAQLSKLIGFAAGATNDVGEYPIDDIDGSDFWQENQTMLLELELERTQAPETFQLYPSGTLPDAAPAAAPPPPSGPHNHS